MTFDEASAVLERVTYRPGWSLRLRDTRDRLHPYGPASLIVEARVEDSYHPGAFAIVTHNQPLPPLGLLRSEEHLMQQVRGALGRVELHERDEWLRLDGAMPFDPHAAEAARA